MDTGTQHEPRERLAIFVGYAVTLVWVISGVADAALDKFSMSPFTHAAMMAVVGALFGGPMLKRNGNGKGNGDQPRREGS